MFVIVKLLGIWTLEIAVACYLLSTHMPAHVSVQKGAIFTHILPGYSSVSCIILLQDDVRDPPEWTPCRVKQLV